MSFIPHEPDSQRELLCEAPVPGVPGAPEHVSAATRANQLEAELRTAARRIGLAETALGQARQRELNARVIFSAEAERFARTIDDQQRTIESAQGHVQALEAALAGQSWRPALRAARRVVRLAWWAFTPWRLRHRLQFLREQRRREEAGQGFDLMRDDLLQEAAGLPVRGRLWPLQAPEQVTERWSAVRFVLDRLRTDADLRSRFPLALSQPRESGFADWLLREGPLASRLSSPARQALATVLDDDPGARPRQIFLFRDDIRAGMPLGLTPPGQWQLFQWFMHHGRHEHSLRVEEILWLLMKAAERPALEVLRAYRFTPAWQQRHPDGLTVFGRDAFAQWLAGSYRLKATDWLHAPSWPEDLSPAQQLRQAYARRSFWRALHPDAMVDRSSAAAFVEWLRHEAPALTDDVRAWCRALDVPQVAAELAAGGINVLGHFCSPSGVRVSAESLVEGLRQAQVATSVRDLRTDVQDEPHHVDFDGLEEFDVTLIHTQPEPFFPIAYERCDLAPRSPKPYRIAYWYWEFDTVPRSWLERAAGVDEVWAATEFVAQGLRVRLPVPVRTLFPGVRLGDFERRDKRHFGIEEGTFVFLFSFHMNSVMERKNPLGLIRAFRRAFRPEEPVTLVVKTMFGHHRPAELQQLRDAAAGARIQVIDETYSAQEVLALTAACDAYVSLHRSEGLGLTMAEAMLLGKPVVATGYSGNVDFMDETNSVLVPYELVELGVAMPPYDADYNWAEPSVDHAAAAMRRMVDEPDWARELGARAKASAEARLSVEAAGRRVAARLAEIRNLRAQEGPRPDA